MIIPCMYDKQTFNKIQLLHVIWICKPTIWLKMLNNAEKGHWGAASVWSGGASTTEEVPQ